MTAGETISAQAEGALSKQRACRGGSHLSDGVVLSCEAWMSASSNCNDRLGLRVCRRVELLEQLGEEANHAMEVQTRRQ